MRQKRGAAVLITALALAPSALAAPRIEGVAVRPNPATFAGGTPPEVQLSVTVRRAGLDRTACEVIIDPGDGGQALRLVFNAGDDRTKKVGYTYAKPGLYRLTARGFGSQPCEGDREVSVTVQLAPDAAAASPSPGAAAASKPKCPKGWTLVADSVRGARYTCRANPPAKPLKCADGTTYFAEKGAIGCR